MRFDALLGNERLKESLTSALSQGRISHFYLISGPEGSGKHTLARLLAAAILCRSQEKPCLHCTACRKVMAGSHPDFITIDDPEKKTVPVDLIRRAREDLYIQPNESDHKIYLFPRAQDMGIPGQNALLKVLEEPPEYGVFLLLADNPDKLLVTIRSRCTELRMQPLPEKVMVQALQQEDPGRTADMCIAAARRSGGFLGQASALLKTTQMPEQTKQMIQALCTNDHVLLVRTLTSMEKWKRDELIPMLRSWQAMVEEAMVLHCGIPALTNSAALLAKCCSLGQLRHILSQLQKAEQYAAANVSCSAVCGGLVWSLRRTDRS